MNPLSPEFIADTLLWTGILMALVLLIRRPVARMFGARAAYALWLLPVIRLILPPMTLPAWMAPETPAPAAQTAIDPILLQQLAAAQAIESPVVTQQPSQWSSIDWAAIALAIWALGAGVFLARRFWLYYEMRRGLLANAVPVGGLDAIRFVETPDVTGPVAFGIHDKVVALPLGFMTQRDRTSRDLALAHELAHHKGGDLLANFAVQPLFAAHWFNPLGLMGWRAMRRDQEAACDARVIAGRPKLERACYASVIAEFATLNMGQTRQALAAPMACPVLGDKSVVQRLRSLSMSDISARRRLMGRIAIVASALALPLTATISYASPDLADQNEAFDEAFAERAEAEEARAEAVERRMEVQEQVEEVRVAAEEARVRAEEARTEAEEVRRQVYVIKGGEGEDDDTKRKVRVIRKDKGKAMAIGPDGEEIDMKEMRIAMSKLEGELADLDIVIAKAVDGAMENVDIALAMAGDEHVKVIEDCDGEESVSETMSADGKHKIIRICESKIEATAIASALNGIKSARAAIAADKEMPADTKAEVLRALDQEIAELQQRSS